MKIPRKTKKATALKRGVIVLDLVSIPKNISLDNWNYIARFTGVAIWDSSLGGVEPKLIGRKYKRFNVVDLAKNNPNLRGIVPYKVEIENSPGGTMLTISE